MLTEYRQRFTQFQSELSREEYLFNSGQKERPETAHIYAENSDLFSRSAIDELQKSLAETGESRETDREAISRLIAFAIEGSLSGRVRELSAEIAAYEAQATIRWQDQTLSFHEALNLPVSEANAQRRRDLLARLGEVIRGAQDLRAERLERLHEAAHDFNGQNYLALYSELRGADYERLATQLTAFLSATESRYVTVLSFILPRDAGVSIDSATRADIGYLQRLPRFDEYFPRWRLREVYEETFRGLGLRTWQQANITIDDAPRPRKQPRPFCAPIQIPDDIRLVIGPGNGWHDYPMFLHEAGHAQHFAWTSRQLFPEFRWTGDFAVTETWAFLLQFLLLDEKWLMEMLGFYESSEFRHTLAAHRLMFARRYAAKLIYEVELHAEKLTGTAGARYAELLTDAVRVKYDETEHLRDLDDGFYSANYLRALAFEAQLREYLKSRYGTRWWASRKAGEMLVDLWNTGLRYSAERLAAMIGLGELSFDWLAEELMQQVKFKQ
ncbi:MAG TPA: hypothetical protein VNQ79_08640 [Blastocatellia bacterium]|nr:hypothetical protein [Blastocatellia bacterium]